MTALEKLVSVPVHAKLFTILHHFGSREALQNRHATSLVANAKISSLQRVYVLRKENANSCVLSLLGNEYPRQSPSAFAAFHV